jgi:YkoY family integral membrane protein
MPGQVFSLSDIPRVAVLAFLEILLSADNAIVLGVIASRLQPALRKKALFIGFLSAWIFRLFGILAIAVLLSYSWIQVFGGAYLIYLMFHHWIKKAKQDPLLPQPTVSFWRTVLLIELFDLAFAVDSIVAGVAFIGVSNHTPFHPKLWVVYVGGMIGVFAIRYAAQLFSFMIHRFPRLDAAAFGMIGWIGLKLTIQGFSLTFPLMDLVFWLGLAILFLFGLKKPLGSRKQ